MTCPSLYELFRVSDPVAWRGSGPRAVAQVATGIAQGSKVPVRSGSLCDCMSLVGIYAAGRCRAW